jgi:SAM-dependent methyltransferase
VAGGVARARGLADALELGLVRAHGGIIAAVSPRCLPVASGAVTHAQRDRMDRADLWGALKDAPDIQKKVGVFAGMIPPEVQSIVDIGCGDGAITNALGERWQVTGVDLSSAALAHVAVEAVLADARELPFAAQQFDLALSSEMLEHLDDESYASALAECKRVARSYLLISVPYREDLDARMIRCPRCGHRQHVWGHVRRFTLESLARDLSGFEMLEARIFGDLQPRPWPRSALWVIHNVFRRWYLGQSQKPQCELCGNTNYVDVRGFPRHSDKVKSLLDRTARSGPLPYWLGVLARRSSR